MPDFLVARWIISIKLTGTRGGWGIICSLLVVLSIELDFPVSLALSVLFVFVIYFFDNLATPKESPNCAGVAARLVIAKKKNRQSKAEKKMSPTHTHTHTRTRTERGSWTRTRTRTHASVGEIGLINKWNALQIISNLQMAALATPSHTCVHIYLYTHWEVKGLLSMSNTWRTNTRNKTNKSTQTAGCLTSKDSKRDREGEHTLQSLQCKRCFAPYCVCIVFF